MTTRLRRYTVFVWTASEEFNAIRDACIQTTWDEGHSADSRLSAIASVDTIERIRTADIFVCLCGNCDDNTKEYIRVAATNLRPVLLLLPENTAEAAVAELKQLVEGAPEGSSLKTACNDPLRFAKEYLIALHRAVRVLDGTLDSEHVSEPTYFPNRFFQRLTTRMSHWWVVHHRSHVNPVLKQAVAEYVLDRYVHRLVAAKVFKLYFESGSSIAFLSQAFAARLDDAWLRMWAEFEIETNNIFTYLEFLVAPAQRTSLFPEGPPDHKYGATYGRLLSVEPPDDRTKPIADQTRQLEIMEEIRDHFRRTYSQNGLIFSATSGIDWDLGPHVGSNPNRLFKRAMLESYCPNLILLDEDKLGRRFNPETCFAVCDQTFSWEHARREVPLALACAFSRKENATTLEPRLRALGFPNIVAGSKHHTPWCVIAANDRFAGQIERWEEIGNDEQRPLTLADTTRAIGPRESGNRLGNIRRN